MNTFKQIVTKASLATVVIIIGLADLPANADTYSKKCTRGANNSVTCTTSGSSSTRSSSSSTTSGSGSNRNSSSSTTSGSSSTRSRSNSSRTNTNVDVNVSEKDVENLFKGIFNRN